MLQMPRCELAGQWDAHQTCRVPKLHEDAGEDGQPHHELHVNMTVVTAADSSIGSPIKQTQLLGSAARRSWYLPFPERKLLDLEHLVIAGADSEHLLLGWECIGSALRQSIHQLSEEMRVGSEDSGVHATRGSIPPCSVSFRQETLLSWLQQGAALVWAPAPAPVPALAPALQAVEEQPASAEVHAPALSTISQFKGPEAAHH